MGIFRIADLMYNDGEIWPGAGKIVDENKKHFCIRSTTIWGHSPLHVYHWVLKFDTAIKRVRWNTQAKFVFGLIVLLLVMTPISLINVSFTPDYGITAIDPYTKLPIAGVIFHPDQLPDGHYTVSRWMSGGNTSVILHLPGPCRDFVYGTGDMTIVKMAVGDRFLVFNGKIVASHDI